LRKGASIVGGGKKEGKRESFLMGEAPASGKKGEKVILSHGDPQVEGEMLSLTWGGIAVTL